MFTYVLLLSCEYLKSYEHGYVGFDFFSFEEESDIASKLMMLTSLQTIQNKRV